MKVVVISDSHGDKAAVKHIIEKERPQTVVHLGDHVTDVAISAMPPEVEAVYKVNGNCDFSSLPSEITKEICGFKFLIMHGHTRGVKKDLSEAIEAAKQEKAHVLLYGHTHLPKILNKEGVLIVNPGSAKKRGFCSFQSATYAVLELNDEGSWQVSIKKV